MATPVPFDPEVDVVSAEMEVQRRLTKAFIADRPESIWIRRPVRVADGAGGAKLASEDAEIPQVVRMIGQGQSAPVDTGGRTTRYEYVLLGEWDADVQRGDVFEYQGKTITVEFMYNFNGYEVRAGCGSAT